MNVNKKTMDWNTHNIIVIAKNTYRETIRDRILYGILGVAVLFIVFTIFLGSISLGEDIVVIKSVGLAGIYFFGLMITVFLGVSLLYKEIEKRTLYFVLPKPVRHSEIIIGKFIGLLLSILLTTAAMLGVYVVIVLYSGGGFDWLALIAVFLQLLEMTLFIAIAICLSMLFTPLVSIIYAVLLVFIGHSIWLVLQYAPEFGAIPYYIILGVYYIFPNLEKFNVRNLTIHGVGPPPQEIFSTVLYAVAYTILILTAATALFRRREF